MTAPRLRQPYYSITSSSLCQALFLIFFKIFFACLRSGRFPAPLFSLSWAAFCALPLPSLCDSLTMLSHISVNVKCLLQVIFVFFYPCEMRCVSLNFYWHIARAFFNGKWTIIGNCRIMTHLWDMTARIFMLDLSIFRAYGTKEKNPQPSTKSNAINDSSKSAYRLLLKRYADCFYILLNLTPQPRVRNGCKAPADRSRRCRRSCHTPIRHGSG